MHRREIHRLRVARVAHVGDHDAAADPRADIGVAACDHDLHAVAPAALVGVADEFDVPCAFGDDHGLLPSLFGRLIGPLPGRIGAMPTYVMLANWTDQGVRTIEDSPKRVDTARKSLEDMGGRFLSVYMTMGGTTWSSSMTPPTMRSRRASP